MSTPRSKKGLTFQKKYTTIGIDVYDEIQWDKNRTAEIKNMVGERVFFQENMHFPTSWSQLATNVVASKYFRGHIGNEDREYSVSQLIDRVANTITEWGAQGAYFASQEDAYVFSQELKYILVNQMAAFNSPVWFNVGVKGREHPQCSACFINSVEDSMESILDLAKTEGMIFKHGSGAGTNFSSLRAKGEKLGIGGTASGPLSFLRGYDQFAGAIKSGGTTRRAACMRLLDCYHPDIEAFIGCKAEEEKKAHALIDAGWDGMFNAEGGAYDSVQFQNANNSVRATDYFMNCALEGKEYDLTARVSGDVMKTVYPSDLLDQIAQGTWFCGDPGMQFTDTINSWHTCSNTDPIFASNPCSEFVFLDDTSCNLASINLMKYLLPGGTFDVGSYEHTIGILITAMEIIVGNSSYPNKKIEERTKAYRPLGLGYANLGSLLMTSGMPYDSDEGRAYAAVLTSLLTAKAYEQSAIISRDATGPFEGYEINQEPMTAVLHKHHEHSRYMFSGKNKPIHSIKMYACNVWQRARDVGSEWGYRNAQATVLAPTGTIGFLMDCQSTGIEPDIALVKYKNLVGGGLMKLTNSTVPKALRNLGYSEIGINEITTYIKDHDTIEGCELLNPDHLAIFDCAFKAQNGTRSIAPMGHLKMMAAVQPFLSGAISKTVNVPETATPEDIKQAYIEAWKMGIKAVAIYRDNSKRTQPLTTKKDGTSSYEKQKETIELKPIKMEDTTEPTGRQYISPEHAGYAVKRYEHDLETLSSMSDFPPADTIKVSEVQEKFDPEPESKSEHKTMGTWDSALKVELESSIPEKTVPQKSVPQRRKLPDERMAITHKFSVAGHEGYLTVGMYEDGTMGELFVTMNKEGSTLSGLMDVFATSISLGIQYGVPLEVYVKKFTHVRFEPSGYTPNPDIRIATSIVDYIFRWLEQKFQKPAEQGTGTDLPGRPEAAEPLTVGDQVGFNAQGKVVKVSSIAPVINIKIHERYSAEQFRKDIQNTVQSLSTKTSKKEAEPGIEVGEYIGETIKASFPEKPGEVFQNQTDSPPCSECGQMMVRNGACYKCLTCGSTSGCS